jgi:hypothetical protein
MRFNSIRPLLAYGFAVATPWLAANASDIEAGPFLHQFSLTLEEGRRDEAMGPFWHHEQNAMSVTYAVPPFFSHARNTTLDIEEYDFLYPLVTYDRHGTEYRLQWLQLLSYAGGKNQADKASRRYTFFPFVFIQRSQDTNENYTAVLPFGGRIGKRLFRDESKFVMFPLYLETRKKDVVTDNYLFPIYHQRHGDGLKGWQLWPFYGAEHKAVTTRTNLVDEPEIVPGHDKSFVLWPLVANEKTGLGTDNPATNRIVLPFFSTLRSPKRDSSTYLWPLFTITEDRAQKYREYGMPWPFYVYTRGEGKTVNRVFPIYSHAYSTNLESGFCFWPIYKYNRFHDTAGEQRRDRVFYFIYSDTTVKPAGAKIARRRTDLWPLFTARRDENGNERLQLLAPMESVVPENPAIERNLSPLWSVWRAEQNGQTGKRSGSLLWNLYRQEDGPNIKKRSFLFGLFHYESGPEGTRWRVCYIPFGKTKPVKSGDAPK